MNMARGSASVLAQAQPARCHRCSVLTEVRRSVRACSNQGLTNNPQLHHLQATMLSDSPQTSWNSAALEPTIPSAIVK